MSQSTNPTVCAVMLVNGRHEMVKRAIRSFQAQTYQEKHLYLLDNGDVPCTDALPDKYPKHGILYHRSPRRGRTIGELRNYAIDWAGIPKAPDIIVHMDSDDVSHPNRIAEQVSLLQASGKECVGYRDMLFWDEESVGEAWFYVNGQRDYCLGTSLCYWRSVWEKRPFEHLPKGPTGMGEDARWLAGVDSIGDVSFNRTRGVNYPDEPRMIASVHGGNTSSMMSIAIKVKDHMVWRAREWDNFCATRMKL